MGNREAQNAIAATNYSFSSCPILGLILTELHKISDENKCMLQ